MILRNKRLIIGAVATLILLGSYTAFIDNAYFSIGKSVYPEVSEQEALETVAYHLRKEQAIDISPHDMVAELFVNADAERFLEVNGLVEQYTSNEHVPPISMWKVSYYNWEYDLNSTYFVDMMTGDIVGFLDPFYYDESFQDEAETDGINIAQEWLAERGITDDYTYMKDEVNADDVVIHHFISKQPVAGDRPLLLKIYTLDGWFIGFYPKLDIPESDVTSPFIESLSSGLSIAVSFAYMGLIFIVGLIYWAMRGTDKSLSAPIPILTGMVLVVTGMLMITDIIGLMQGIAYGVLVFMAMLAVYSKRNNLGSRSPERMAYLREKVLQGYLLGMITFLPSFVFYTIAENGFNAWGSSEDAFLMLEEAKWVMLTPFLIGLFAAVSEEIMFRKFGEFVFKRVWNNQLFIALITSFIWSIGHLAYTVHPWYLRIVELTFFVGPFLYWVYKKYGLTVAIMSHYLFNCISVSLTLMSFDADRYVYSLLYLLVPLVIYVIPAKHRKLTQTPGASTKTYT